MTRQALSIVMLVHNRPRLTRQALESLERNTQGSYRLTIYDDGSSSETERLLWPYYEAGQLEVMHAPASDGPGIARNNAIRLSEATFGRPGLLYLADNDCWFAPGWDETLLKCWNAPERAQEGFLALGGYAHPFQQRGRLISNPGAMAGHSIAELEALGLLSWLMEWETWDKYGPLEPSPTINGSEDWALSQRIRRDGGRVGVIEPACVVNCGVTGSDDRPCPGAALLYDQNAPPEVIIE